MSTLEVQHLIAHGEVYLTSHQNHIIILHLHNNKFLIKSAVLQYIKYRNVAQTNILKCNVYKLDRLRVEKFQLIGWDQLIFSGDHLQLITV